MESTECGDTGDSKWQNSKPNKIEFDDCLTYCKSNYNSDYVLFGRPDVSWPCSGSKCVCKCSIVPNLDCEKKPADGVPFDLYKQLK